MYCPYGNLEMPTPYSILIVEDHEATRQGLQALLSNAGYEVRSAGTFADGRRALAEHKPDLLIADLRLGAFNGLQLVAGIPMGLPSIIVTGFPDSVLAADARKLGAHYITKPVNPERLLTLVEETLVKAAQRHSRGSTRRWDRKPVGTQVAALVENVNAQLVNVSYGGVRFEIEREHALPPSFSLTVASPPVSVDVNLVWETRTGERHWICGAAISGNAAAVHGWATLVDHVAATAEA
jgi:DNA-binding response OmpR family regulator